MERIPSLVRGDRVPPDAEPVVVIDQTVQRRAPHARVGVSQEFLEAIEATDRSQRLARLGGDHILPVIDVPEQRFTG